MIIGRMRIASWISKASNTHRLCNSHYFSTATIVARTRLNVTLYLYCQSCLSQAAVYMYRTDSCAKSGYPTAKSGLILEVFVSPFSESSDQRFAFCSGGSLPEDLSIRQPKQVHSLPVKHRKTYIDTCRYKKGERAHNCVGTVTNAAAFSHGLNLDWIWPLRFSSKIDSLLCCHKKWGVLSK
jgi:hypothetical protein